MFKLSLEAISLSTPRGRLLFWLAATLVIFVSRFEWLENLSIWQRIGLDWMPSIGLTRSYWHLIHGNFVAAYNMNPLIFLVVLVGGTILARDFLQAIKTQK